MLYTGIGLVLLYNQAVGKLAIPADIADIGSLAPEDQIDEDLSKLDLSTLPLISSEPKHDENCVHRKQELRHYRYDTNNKKGEPVSILIGETVVIDDTIQSPLLTNEDKPWLNGTLLITPSLNCLDQDDPRLVEEVRKRLVAHHKAPYNFSHPVEDNVGGEVGQPLEVDRIVFGGELKNGFFLEAGAWDFEEHSNTLHFELEHGWTGLLVEPHPLTFAEGMLKNRKTQNIQTCFSTTTKPQEVIFDIIGSIRNETHRESMGGITNETRGEGEYIKMQCFPMYSVLLALGNPTVHYFSLDVEGAEFPILKTLPWDKVDIQVLSVETHLCGRLFPGTREELIAYMDSVGYNYIAWGHTGLKESRVLMGTKDDLFVRKDIQLKMKENDVEELNKDEL